MFVTLIFDPIARISCFEQLSTMAFKADCFSFFFLFSIIRSVENNITFPYKRKSIAYIKENLLQTVVSLTGRGVSCSGLPPHEVEKVESSSKNVEESRSKN